jgi:hypothetical protein
MVRAHMREDSFVVHYLYSRAMPCQTLDEDYSFTCHGRMR